MKKRLGWISVIVLAGLLVAAFALRPQATMAESPAEQKRTLDVTGYGKLTIKYDTAQITLGVSELKETANGAYSAMGTSMDKVAAAMKAAGVKEDDIKTGMLSLYEEKEWGKDGPINKGYRATNTITITTQKLDKVADLIQAAMNAGANTMQGVTFQVKDTTALTNQALDLAVADAKAKAERVAKSLGADIVGVMKVSVQDSGGSPVMYDSGARSGAMMKAEAAPAAPVFSGTGEFTANVYVSFEIR